MKNFKKRFATSIFANLFRGGSTIFVGILLARFLGVEDYGALAFLVATGIAIKQLMDLGTSSAFFTFLSQEAKSRKFVFKFFTFFFGKYLVCILLILFVFPSPWIDKIWLSQGVLVIVVSIVAVSMQFDFWPLASQLLESQRETIKVQWIFVVSQLIHIGLILVLHYRGHLTILNYLILVGVLWFLVACVVVALYRPMSPCRSTIENAISIKDYLNYCGPIAPIMIISITTEFMDKWMLQNWGGERQQGLYAVSAQIASGALLITASFIKIFWKEVAENWHAENYQHSLKIYLGARKLIFYCGSFIAASAIPWASNIVDFLYGPTYIGATTALMILMLYSMHQSLGQIDSAFLMATGNTKVGLKTNIILAPIGIIISFVMLSNEKIFSLGLDLGAAGLALKALICQLVSVNLIAYLMQKEIKIKFDYIDQIKIPLILIVLSLAIKEFTLKIFVDFEYIYIYSISLYALVILLSIKYYPKLTSFPSDMLEKLKML